MRLKYFKGKIVSLTFVFLILLQSCSVYQKTPVTLDEAAKSNSRILIEQHNKKKIEFAKIEYKDGAYFGVKKVNGQITSLLLNEKDIKSVRVLDKSKTDFATIGLIIGCVLLVGIVVLAATFTVPGPN